MIRRVLLFAVVLFAWDRVMYGAAPLISVACGSATDSGFTGGTTYALPGQPVPYDHLRYTATTMSYSFAVVPGSYVVTLRFVENRPTQTVGARIFSVSINGSVVLPALDIFAEVGALTPDDHSFPAVSTGTITIVLTASVGNAVISGIQIGLPPPLTPTYITASEASAPVVCPAGLTFLASTEGHLFWCYAPGPWHQVGDVSNIPTPPPVGPVLVGTLVNGACQPWGTGFHLEGAVMVSNESAGNCALP